MSKYKNFQEYCTLDKEGKVYGSRFLQNEKNALRLALEQARKVKDKDGNKIPEEKIQLAEEKGMLDGSFEITYEVAQRFYDKTRARMPKERQDLIDCFDPVRDADLLAYCIFCCDEEIRKKVKNYESLYKILFKVGSQKKQGHDLPPRTKTGYAPSETGLLPLALEELIADIPREQFTGDQEYQRRGRILLERKADRDIFPKFRDNESKAFKEFEKRIADPKLNENLRDVYKKIIEVYKAYSEFEIKNENKNFEDPETGEKDVLPSLHQKIAIYRLLKEKKFGIFDGCGTGKTAVAVLAKPLIEEELKKQGKEFTRAIVVCPYSAFKAWKKGLIGEANERYLSNKEDILVINGKEEKDENFIKKLKNKKWIVLLYEQLLTKVKGSNKLFSEKLIELGFDYVIFDESHHIKNQKIITPKGKPTISTAARALGNKAEYLCLLTGTPIPDKLDDYAVAYSLLNRQRCPDPTKFKELYQEDPRLLYTFFNEKAIRRTLDDIDEALEYEEVDKEVQLTPVQRKLYNFIIENKPKDWLIQARKALIDPRLVNPKILIKTDLIDKLSYESSAKYKTLIDLLTSENGPIAKGEKFVIFSSMFRDGVTQVSSEKIRKKEKKPGEKEKLSLKEKYEKLGLKENYKKLELEKTLEILIKKELKKKYGREFNLGIIDGTISEKERERIVDGLKDGLAGILCTTDTGGESFDLIHANHAIFLDEDYCPKTPDQALPRLLRKGQKKKVMVTHLLAKNTLEEPLKDYVEEKRLIIRIASDGYRITEEEEKFLEDTTGKKLEELIRKNIGGISIDVSEANILSPDDFKVKKRNRHPARQIDNIYENYYEPTDAQKLKAWIFKDPLNCWKDPEFVELYVKTLNNLAVPVIHTAKICDIVNRATRKEIEFPTKVLSEGSGPSILYDAYQNLADLVRKQGFEIPMIVDRDTSEPMLRKGKNPYKLLGCMTGRNSAIQDNVFDMVDNESISLLKDSQEVKDSLLEANRVLKQDGLIELIVKNRRFMDGFYNGLENLGFEILTEENEGFYASSNLLKRLRKEKGRHFAGAYESKLGNTHLILARKKEKSAEVSADNFWFETIAPLEEVSEIKIPKKEIIKPEFTPRKKVIVDKFGNVISVKNVEENDR